MADIPDFKIVRSKRKSVSIHILPDASVEVRAPLHIPQLFIKGFVKSKSFWIAEKQKLVKSTIKKPKKFVDGEIFMFLGNAYTLQIGNYTDIETKGDKLLFPSALMVNGRDTLEKWYIKRAKKIIREQVAYYARKMNASYASVSFSDTSSKWGSCTHDNRLQFNWRLVMTPQLVIRYVVLHELVHTTTKNHSYIFWNKVRVLNPSYKQQIKWLKLHGNGLKI
jgi:predicted metal-dependent hydrolase